MGKFFVYVLKSVSSGKHYTGQTNDIHRRIYEHNAEILGKFTKNKGPWILIFSKEFGINLKSWGESFLSINIR